MSPLTCEYRPPLDPLPALRSSCTTIGVGDAKCTPQLLPSPSSPATLQISLISLPELLSPAPLPLTVALPITI